MATDPQTRPMRLWLFIPLCLVSGVLGFFIVGMAAVSISEPATVLGGLLGLVIPPAWLLWRRRRHRALRPKHTQASDPVRESFDLQDGAPSAAQSAAPETAASHVERIGFKTWFTALVCIWVIFVISFRDGSRLSVILLAAVAIPIFTQIGQYLPTSLAAPVRRPQRILVGLTGLALVIGSAIKGYQRNHFDPTQFPACDSSEMLQNMQSIINRQQGPGREKNVQLITLYKIRTLGLHELDSELAERFAPSEVSRDGRHCHGIAVLSTGETWAYFGLNKSGNQWLYYIRE